MSDEVVKFVQEHSKSKVTHNFVVTLTKLAQNCRGDLDKFVVGCEALGMLNDDKTYLKTLFIKLSNKNSLDPNLCLSNKVELPRRKLNLQLEYSEEDDDDDESLPIMPQRAPRRPLKFKRIGKDMAQRLREYDKEPKKEKGTSVMRTEPKRINKSVHIARPRGEPLPQMQTYADDEIEQSEGETSDSLISEDALSEDREWYNNDDDYGNAVASQEVSRDLNFRPASEDEKSFRLPTMSVQVYPMSLSKRKQFLPPFLKKNYGSPEFSNSAIIGSFLDASQSGAVSPFKNPDGELSMNAKKGSRLVALRRLQKDKTNRAKETADIVGTALGNLLGLKENEKNRQSASTHVDATDTGMPSRGDIDRARKALPAYQIKSQIIQTIRDHQVTVVIGETGSGKTTQLAQYLNEAGLCKDNRIIGCTQPRRVAAMSVAKRVALEMDVKLGQEVGYSIRFEDCTSSKTRVKFMTDGILLREALMDETLEKYGCIIIDEAHERSLNTDVILGLFKRLLARRRDIKLIITSATINATKFSSFFGGAPLFTIPGRTFPIEIVYSKHPVSDYVESSVMQAIRIHMSTGIDTGDILIFMTGQEDIEATADTLRQKLTEIYSKRLGVSRYEEIDDIEIFPIYSALPADIQNHIFKRLEQGKRKIVIATNIAETSLTIDGIKYVVDCGYSKLKLYNPKIGLDSLTITPISKANADQRSGRAGRTGPGMAYRMYTEEAAYDDMYNQTIPEIQRTNLSNTVLLLKSLGVDDILRFPFIDPPPLQTLLASLYELHFLGALDNWGNLTRMGSKMSKFPIRPSLSKALLISATNGCNEEMVTIVSMLSVPMVFYRPSERQKEADRARSRFFVPESDHLTLLNVYGQWRSNRYSAKWCSRHFLQYRSLQRAREIREQLIKIMQSQEIELVSSGTEWDIVRKCICSGFSYQAAKISGLGKYNHLQTGMEVQLHPTSALYGMGDLPPYVVYHELLMTTREYINCVTSVDPFWLMEFGGFLYEIKRIKDMEGNGGRGFMDTVSDDQDETENQPDELDLRVKNCLVRRDMALQRIQQCDKQSTKRYSDGPNSSQKKRENSNVQIGFTKRRPF
ncbi:related to Pre-mRNA-splicing factor ATP-dependent RNA helicase PRP16 [Zygosaccharomyces bailii ISA1307]|nr:related to Pre-mRNA-splicing factor ATP-dependent RNA helicase PRP16 [Zygosaccharomyces bailii ISA1307]